VLKTVMLDWKSVGGPLDAAGQPVGLTRLEAGDHLNEALRVHERLELQGSVEEPDQTEHGLNRPAGVRREMSAHSDPNRCGGSRPNDVQTGRS
jgi:hypothetical protein